MQILLRKTSNSFEIISGHLRLQAALESSGEVIVDTPDPGRFVIVRSPDGKLFATQDGRTLEIFGY